MVLAVTSENVKKNLYIHLITSTGQREHGKCGNRHHEDQKVATKMKRKKQFDAGVHNKN